MVNDSSSPLLSLSSSSSSSSQTSLSCMASPILMPDLDMDSTVEAKEYTGAVDPSDVAAMKKGR